MLYRIETLSILANNTTVTFYGDVMDYFSALLYENNFVFTFNGKVEIGGFYTSRWVKTNSEVEADLQVVILK